MSDIYKVKFEKLIVEYGKLLTQLKVVKRGYTDSQANVNKLSHLLKQIEKLLRQNEIETESLNFRNQQLTKRVSVLQSDLDASERKVSKTAQNVNKKINKSTDNIIIQEELQKRILENSKLVCQLEENLADQQRMKDTLEKVEKINFEKEMKYKIDILRLKNLNQNLTQVLQPQQELKLKRCSSDNHIEEKIISGAELMSLQGFSASEETPEEQRLQKRCRKLEQESQVLKMKYEVLKMENKTLQIKNKNFIEKNDHWCDSSDEEISNKPVWHCNQATLSSDIGILTAPFPLSEEVYQREQHIIKYFQKEISKIVTEKQQYESLIDLYSAECEALTLRLNCYDMENNTTGTQV